MAKQAAEAQAAALKAEKDAAAAKLKAENEARVAAEIAAEVAAEKQTCLLPKLKTSMFVCKRN